MLVEVLEEPLLLLPEVTAREAGLALFAVPDEVLPVPERLELPTAAVHRLVEELGPEVQN